MTPSGAKAALTRVPVVVLGATGSVGRGVVAAAVAAGRPVIAVARELGELKALRAAYGDADITVLAGSVASDAEGAKLARALRKLGRPLAGVVAAVCGSTERGRLLDHPAAFLRRKLDEDLLPHLAAARHLLPLLAQADRGGSYVLIGGPGSEHPWAGYGHRSIGEAALRMLARVLHDEARTLSVRVQLLAIDSPVCTERNRAHACPQWPSALAVGQRALALIEQSASSEPARAVVRYTPPPWLSSTRDHDAVAATGEPVPVESMFVESMPVESGAAGSTHSQATVESATTAPVDTGVASPHDPTSLLPTRCLQDARTLLKNLISPNRNQEPSPQ
ncbi:SDR family NAD(P)-dependent oxidoreductase [Lysobacter cavernae]|uniref:SDR family NAD(P)-dependent oxidoreductase n=1 Tax=Lysobacter cavernae TaxID=1685901 RepID=A0ABV7RTG0_9GAMM